MIPLEASQTLYWRFYLDLEEEICTNSNTLTKMLTYIWWHSRVLRWNTILVFLWFRRRTCHLYISNNCIVKRFLIRLSLTSTERCCLHSVIKVSSELKIYLKKKKWVFSSAKVVLLVFYERCYYPCVDPCALMIQKNTVTFTLIGWRW